jgi:hypothetical protein
VKKLVVLLLLPLYLLSVPGLAYSLHFCSKKLTSFSFAQKARKSCACKKAQSPSASDCCDDQRMDTKTDDSQRTASAFKLDAPKLAVLTTLLPHFLARLFALSPTHVSYLEGAFVPLHKIPVYLRIGEFRI